MKLLLGVVLLLSTAVQAQTSDPSATTATASTSPAPQASPDPVVASTSPTPAPHRRPKPKNDAYEQSRYTSDKSESEADHRSLLLAAGIDKVIDLDPSFKADVSRKDTVFIGNTTVAGVAMVKLGETVQLVIKPLAEGETNVTIRDKTGKIRIILDLTVAKQNLVKYLDRLKDHLKEVEGINIGIEDQKIVIRGEVLTPNDYGTIVNEVADKSYADAVVNKTTMSNVTLGALAKKIEQDVQVFAPTVRTNIVNGKIILDGSVDSEAARTRVLKRAEWYLPAVKITDPIENAVNAAKSDKPVLLIQNDIQVTPPPAKRESKLVRLTVYFVELSKDFLKSFGFKWQPGFSAAPSISIGSTAAGSTSTTGSGGFTFAGTLTSLFPTFSSNPSSASYGRVMRTETVVVKSESKGHIDNTQQIPTQQVGQNGTTGTGTPVTVGTSLEVTPKILQGQDVDLDIDMKESANVGTGIGGAPIVDSRNVQTRIYLKSGETAAVAGINTQDTTTTFNRDDPNATTATGNIQALFNLQRSKNMSKSRGQFVVFISPQIIDSASDGTEDLKKNFRIPTSSK